MKILGLSGSLRRDSHNTRLLAGTRKLLPSGVELVIFEALAAIPAFSEDDEHATPPAVAALRVSQPSSPLSSFVLVAVGAFQRRLSDRSRFAGAVSGRGGPARSG